MEREILKKAIMAILFVSGAPAGAEQIAAALEVSVDEVAAASTELVMETAESSLVVQAVAGGWQIRTHARYGNVVKRYLKVENEKKLSRAALEVLSVIAFKQPITRGDIESLRGVDCSGVLDSLLEKWLVEVVGKARDRHYANLYGTTARFLEYMGLKSLADLPRPDEEILSASVEDEVKTA